MSVSDQAEDRGDAWAAGLGLAGALGILLLVSLVASAANSVLGNRITASLLLDAVVLQGINLVTSLALISFLCGAELTRAHSMRHVSRKDLRAKVEEDAAHAACGGTVFEACWKSAAVLGELTGPFM